MRYFLTGLWFLFWAIVAGELIKHHYFSGGVYAITWAILTTAFALAYIFELEHDGDC